MKFVETEETNRFTFEPFAAHEFYTEVNRMLVRQALAHLKFQSGKPLTIVDMACGTGAVSRLIAEEVARLNATTPLQLIGVDPAAEAVRLAEKSMRETYPTVQSKFYQGDVSDLPRLVQNADAAFFCNAIHLVPNKLDAFEKMAQILAPNGIFACNSAFYQGTYVEGTERFYRLWTRRAVGWLRKEHPDVRPSREEKAMAMQWLTPEEYVDSLKQGGFCDVEQVRTDAILSLDAWRDLGQYWLFIEGALPGVPLTYGAAALGNAVYQTGQELGLTEIPRTWLQLVATKCSE
jgi:ubiquinone/menaquinone biosynthesis C-methylase UbiE